MIKKKYIEKTKFQERFESKESQDLILPLKPKITEIATIIIDKLKQKTIKNYIKDPKKLNINWIPSDEFIAYASTTKHDPNDFSINFSYGLLTSLYLEAVGFAHMCTNEYKKSDYDIIFNEFDYGEGRENVIPKEFTQNTLKIALFEYSLSWIYYHEQSHLVQSHGNVYNKNSNSDEYMGIVDNKWLDSSNEIEEKLTGKNAELKHVCELSADHEAIYHIIGDFIKDSDVIKIADLWVLTTCLTYIYNDFYGTKYEFHNGEVIGTHPDPAIRMRLALSHINSILTNDGMNIFFEKGKTKEDYISAVHHAYDVANFYIAHLYHNGMKPQFMNRVYKVETEDKYYQKIATTWKEIRDDIKIQYMGLDDFPFMQL